ncbi:MFS transporter [Marinactinospora thermotolerans]|uniref:Drug resistance transporter, EmrB/QacA subfamily n=1 Tax=Marinactinospora thermotolerans DSM 45154 TaxID=1122192 RepID=A0A1T4K7A9_9ACTN|nr:MFS transporter [Marinactinospora thermotolerans]SJZ38299.1 drug resistance transporter, EmrB/QacA subfamily [Marinactinospora thermotolerans DSM 45154]
MGTITWGSARARWVLLATVVGSGMGFLDGSVVGVALPAIGRDLDASMAGLQWVLNGYTLTLAALILISGSLGDRVGRRRVFLIGTVGFALASVLCALAPTIETLIAARVAQGVGAALLTPNSLALLEAEFTEDDSGRAIGAWSGLTGVANAAGPFLGGWLVDIGDWRLIFLINVPLAALVVAVGLRHLPESRPEEGGGRRLDWTGATLTVVSLGALTYALTVAGEVGVSSWRFLVPAGTGVLVVLLFARSLRRSRHPLIPPRLFADRVFVAANLVTLGVYAALGVTFFLLVIQLQQVLGYSAVQAGVATLPITLLMLLLSARSGDLARRIGPRAQMTAGPLVMALGLLLMGRIGPGSGYVTEVLPAVVLLGLGLAATVAPLTATALGAAGPADAGVASGVNNAVSRAAQLASVAAVPALVGVAGDAYLDPARFDAGFSSAMLVAAALAASAGLVALLLIRRPRGEAEEGPSPYACGLDAAPLRRAPCQDPGRDAG